MKRIEQLKIKVRKAETIGLVHDSRHDVRVLSSVINAIVEKQNEIINAVNQLIEAENRRSGHDQ